jgi:predicted nucleic acid-binding protein
MRGSDTGNTCRRRWAGSPRDDDHHVCGTMDLKIAAIVLSHDGTLLSKNLSDFRKVPRLKVADWTLPGED